MQLPKLALTPLKTLQEVIILLIERIGQKFPFTPHVQLDQSVILDKSLWTYLF
jgi:hypothetical protein